MKKISENTVYSYLVKYEPLFGLLDKEDVLQEIRFAFLTAKDGELFRVAAKLLRNLATDYGYTRRMGKDKVQTYYDNLAKDLSKEQEVLLQKLEDLYIHKNMTAREVSNLFNINFDSNVAKLFCLVFPKHQGRGGKRKNAGRKKTTKR